jgi:hypothetical protein
VIGMDEEKPIKQIYLDMLLETSRQNGLREAVHLACNDRYICKILGVNYCAMDVFTQVKNIVLDYQKQKGE